MVDNADDGARMVERVFRGAPDTGDAKLAATAVGAVVRAIDPALCMAAARFDAPAVQFGVFQSLFDFLFRVRRSGHQVPHPRYVVSGCQVTTIGNTKINARNDPSRPAIG
jgi:hypothetical protein